mmetsp:Transcript_97832/g.254978  ORF Transcript_97832/g.254978 Transcript_97832/m.254978 type:complete len:419 (-) Transcript_97832:855-2111(-)
MSGKFAPAPANFGVDGVPGGILEAAMTVSHTGGRTCPAERAFPGEARVCSRGTCGGRPAVEVPRAAVEADAEVAGGPPLPMSGSHAPVRKLVRRSSSVLSSELWAPSSSSMPALIFVALVCLSAAFDFCTERYAKTQKPAQQARIKKPNSKGHHDAEAPPPSADVSSSLLVSPVTLVAVVVVVSVVVGDGVGRFVLPPITATPSSRSCTGPPSAAISHTKSSPVGRPAISPSYTRLGAAHCSCTRPSQRPHAPGRTRCFVAVSPSRKYTSLSSSPLTNMSCSPSLGATSLTGVFVVSLSDVPVVVVLAVSDTTEDVLELADDVVEAEVVEDTVVGVDVVEDTVVVELADESVTEVNVTVTLSGAAVRLFGAGEAVGNAVSPESPPASERQSRWMYAPATTDAPKVVPPGPRKVLLVGG